MENLEHIVASAHTEFAEVTQAAELEQIKARYLGKTGLMSEQMKQLGKLPAEQRPAAGSLINQAKEQIQAALEARRAALKEAELGSKLAAETLDVTLPGRGVAMGGLHPVTITLARIEAIFRSIGFEVAQGPEIETDFYSFPGYSMP